MDAWAVPHPPCPGLDRSSLVDAGPTRTTKVGRVAMCQRLFGLCPRSNDRAWPGFRRVRSPREWNRRRTPNPCPGARVTGEHPGRRGGAGPVSDPAGGGAGPRLSTRPSPNGLQTERITEDVVLLGRAEAGGDVR